MGIGVDISDVLSEVGSVFTIIRASENITGEYGEITVNRQITKPFIFNYFKELTLQYDTQAVPGDILEFETTGSRYILMAVNTEEFENEIVTHEGVLYLANVSGELLRPSETTRDARYRTTQVFTEVSADVYALETESLFGNTLETDQQLGMIGLRKDELYIPSSAGVLVGDRYQPASGEYYKVEVVKRRNFAGVDICELVEDNR